MWRGGPYILPPEHWHSSSLPWPFYGLGRHGAADLGAADGPGVAPAARHCTAYLHVRRATWEVGSSTWPPIQGIWLTSANKRLFMVAALRLHCWVRLGLHPVNCEFDMSPCVWECLISLIACLPRGSCSISQQDSVGPPTRARPRRLRAEQVESKKLPRPNPMVLGASEVYPLTLYTP